MKTKLKRKSPSGLFHTGCNTGQLALSVIPPDWFIVYSRIGSCKYSPHAITTVGFSTCWIRRNVSQ